MFINKSKDGLNNGGNKITKVADGKADDDAATVGQLKNIAVGASGVKESDKKDDWAKEKPKATGKNSVSIGGGSTDGGRSNTVSVGAPGHERTISNVANPVKGTDAVNLNYLTLFIESFAHFTSFVNSFHLAINILVYKTESNPKLLNA